MRMQSNVSASNRSSDLLWKKLKGIAAHLVRQPGILATYTLPSSQGFSVAKGRMHRIGERCERSRALSSGG